MSKVQVSVISGVVLLCLLIWTVILMHIKPKEKANKDHGKGGHEHHHNHEHHQHAKQIGSKQEVNQIEAEAVNNIPSTTANTSEPATHITAVINENQHAPPTHNNTVTKIGLPGMTPNSPPLPQLSSSSAKKGCCHKKSQ